MSELTRPIRRLFGRGNAPADAAVPTEAEPTTPAPAAPSAPGRLDRGRHRRVRPAPRLPPDRARAGRAHPPGARLAGGPRLRAAGVALVVPLVSQGELIGTLNLGPRLSEQDYSTDDRRLLTTLAAQAAPAIRVAQLVREQAHEAAERERLEQEMRVATLIQQQFLPRELPNLPEWQIAAYYGPARAVGGDFYDFIPMPGGRIGIAVGDVTDKGVPAALVMARTHSILRAEASRSDSPGEILARANALLVPEMPARMFVTCLFAILDPATGRIVLANAGHNLPYVRTDDGVIELRATGMPLGLMPDIRYEETEGVIAPGSNVLLYSDGLVEAHDPASRCTASRACARRWRSTTRGASCSTACSTRSISSPAPTGSRRTTSRSSRSGEPPAWPRHSGAIRRLRHPDRVLDPRRRGQRAPGDGPRRGGRRGPRPGAGPPGTPQDRGQRGRR